MLMQQVYAAKDLILDPARTEHDDPHGYVEAIRKISNDTTVPMTYIPGGGAIFFAGRDEHFGNATPKQQAACWEGLQRLGFRRQKVLKVKSINEAATGTAIVSVDQSAGSFVEMKQRVFGDARNTRGRDLSCRWGRLRLCLHVLHAELLGNDTDVLPHLI